MNSMTALNASTVTFSRRNFFKLSAGAALGLGLAASGLATPGTGVARVGAAVAFEAYHDVTGATHQARFNDLSARGFYPLSVSIYANPNDPRYAAVWVNRPAPAFRAVHGVDAAGYQAAFDSAVAAGFVPITLGATGPADNPRFVAVFEQGIAAPWVARHGMTPTDFANQMQQARAQGLIPRSVALYGNPLDRRYAAVWTKNTGNVGWTYRALDTADEYQVAFNQLTGQGYRPSALEVSGDHRLASIWRTDSIGPLEARHNLTSAQYQATFNQLTGQGYVPVAVEGGGDGGNVRFAALFATANIVGTAQL